MIIKTAFNETKIRLDIVIFILIFGDLTRKIP